MNTDLQDLDIKTKFLPKVRKLCDQATKASAELNEPPPQVKPRPAPQQEHPQQLMVPAQSKPRPVPLEDDMSYFVCSMISVMNGAGLQLKDLVMVGNSPDAFVQQFKKTIVRPTGNQNLSDGVGQPRPETGRRGTDQASHLVTGGNRNIVLPKIRRRYGRHGELWIDRLNLASSRENTTYIMELEDPRIFMNQMTMSSSKSEEKLGRLASHSGQVKLARYGELQDFMCFEDREEDVESLPTNFLGAFKKFKADRVKT